jgi:hypothetical protein
VPPGETPAPDRHAPSRMVHRPAAHAPGGARITESSLIASPVPAGGTARIRRASPSGRERGTSGLESAGGAGSRPPRGRAACGGGGWGERAAARGMRRWHRVYAGRPPSARTSCAPRPRSSPSRAYPPLPPDVSPRAIRFPTGTIPSHARPLPTTGRRRPPRPASPADGAPPLPHPRPADPLVPHRPIGETPHLRSRPGSTDPHLRSSVPHLPRCLRPPRPTPSEGSRWEGERAADRRPHLTLRGTVPHHVASRRRPPSAAFPPTGRP